MTFSDQAMFIEVSGCACETGISSLEKIARIRRRTLSPASVNTIMDAVYDSGAIFNFAWQSVLEYLNKNKEVTMKRLFLVTLAATMLIATGIFAADATPKTVIHVITVKWKTDATPAQISKVLEVVATMPSQYPGITRVWTKPIKKQIPEGYNHVIVMEFASEDALKQYGDSSAQKKFYELYMPIREESRTSDITN
jgi:hypothetical protein